jgi:hypothetical protein
LSVGASGSKPARPYIDGGDFPEGIIASQWLIDIRTDLSTPMALAAVAISISGLIATRLLNSRG